MLAGTNKVASEASGAFVEIDDNFIEVIEGLDLGARLVVKGLWAVSDSMLIDDGEC
jgi:hypothetical protein